jgi:lysophospholipase L1-like esterase
LEQTGLALLSGLITAVRDAARARGTELVLFSPIFGDAYHPSFRRYVAERILPPLGQLDAAIIDLLNSPALDENSSWVGDGYHLNATGHQEVARLTQAIVEPILRTRLASAESGR